MAEHNLTGIIFTPTHHLVYNYQRLHWVRHWDVEGTLYHISFSWTFTASLLYSWKMMVKSRQFLGRPHFQGAKLAVLWRVYWKSKKLRWTCQEYHQVISSCWSQLVFLLTPQKSNMDSKNFPCFKGVTLCELLGVKWLISMVIVSPLRIRLIPFQS